jgi:hypothetical protein
MTSLGAVYTGREFHMRITTVRCASETYESTNALASTSQRLLHQATNSPVVERRPGVERRRLPSLFLGATRHFGSR